MSIPPYPYSQGERLEERNTYFYSAYHGQAFFAAWRASRQQALIGLPDARPWPANTPVAALDGQAGYHTQQVLDLLLNADLSQPVNRRLAEHLLQRFEVSKRLYRSYTPQFKAVIDSGYDDLALYVEFAALCLAMQTQADALPFLNGLLKSIDTLIAVQQRLAPELGSHLAWLIAGEASWVERLAARVNVEVGA